MSTYADMWSAFLKRAAVDICEPETVIEIGRAAVRDRR
jgi:hypothetical protein